MEWNFCIRQTNLPTVGDIVVQAEVVEYFDNTELLNITYFETLSSGNDMPIVSQLPTGTIAIREHTKVV